MKLLTWILGALMIVAVIYFGLQVLASETGEVVVLYTDDGAEADGTRLWVVDYQGQPWLRAGAGPGSGWYQQVQEDPAVTLERDGVRRRYLAHPVPAETARINQLMQQKYAWRDDLIGLLIGGRDDAVAIRLTPAE